jgi:hypothetical protein
MSTGWEVDDRIRGSFSISTLELSGATARLSHQPFTHTFTELAQAVRSKGLQGRRRGFYVMIFAVLIQRLLEISWPSALRKDRSAALAALLSQQVLGPRAPKISWGLNELHEALAGVVITDRDLSEILTRDH